MRRAHASRHGTRLVPIGLAAAATLAAVLTPAAQAGDPGELRITDLGAWGGWVTTAAFKGDVMYFHSGGRLVVADVSDPANPVELNAIDFRNVIQAIEVRGDVLYVGGERNTVCFRTFDISDPATPVELSKGCGFFGGSPNQIVFWNDVAYTLHGTDVHAFDVSDPANPVYHQGVYFSLGGPMAVSGDHLYMLNDNADLLVFDLGNAPDPFNPPLVTEFPLPSGGESGSIAIHGTHAYLQPWPPASDLVVVDVSDPLAPAVVGTVPDAGPPNVAPVEDGNNLAISGGVLYVATGLIGSTAVKLFDIATDPAAPAGLGTFTTDADISGVHVSGSTVYVLDEGEGVIIVDASDPANPVRVGGIHSPRQLAREALDGDLLYVSDFRHGLSILDVSDPAHIPMHPVGVFKSGGAENWGIDVHDGLAYLGAGTAGLQIVDVSTPFLPVLVGSFPAEGSQVFDDVVVLDGIAYVGMHCCNPVAGFLFTFDVTDPANVVQLDVLQIGSGRVSEIVVFDNGGQVIVHAVNADFSPAIVTATDPGNLILESTVGPSRSQGIALSESGRFRFVITQNPDAGVYVHDVADPANPVQVGFSPWGGWTSFASGERLYTSRGVMDISDPANLSMWMEWQNLHFDAQRDALTDGSIVYGVQYSGSGGANINLVYEPGDWNADGWIDDADAAEFGSRYSGAGVPFADAVSMVFDFDEDGDVDCGDWDAFKAAWTGPEPTGNPGGGPPPAPPHFVPCDGALCPGDVNGDGATDSADLAVLIGSFGSAVPPGTSGDVNGDGVVDSADLSVLVGGFGCGSE